MSIRVVTWNMQGGGPGASKWVNDVSRLFLQKDAQLVCLQECGCVPADAIAIQDGSLSSLAPCVGFNWNLGSKSKPVTVTVLWLRTRTNNLAVLGQTAFFSQSLVVPTGDSGLLALGISFKIAQGGSLNLYTSNTFFAAGPDDPALLAEVVNNATQAKASWFAVGDFNQEPAEWVWNQKWTQGGLYWGHPPVSSIPGAGTNFDYAFMGTGPSLQSSLAQSLQQASSVQPPLPSAGSAQSGQQIQQPQQPIMGQPSSSTAMPVVTVKVDWTFNSSDHFPVSFDLPFDLAS